MHEIFSIRYLACQAHSLFLTICLGCLCVPQIQAQSDVSQFLRPTEREFGPEEVRLLVTRSMGIGLVTGDIHGNDVRRFVHPGVALTGMIKVLLLYKDPSRRFGPGVLAGISTTIGNRNVYEESVWIGYTERRPLEGKHLHQTAVFIGPMVQFGRKGGSLKYQIGMTWNRSSWNTNLYSYEEGTGNGWPFRDDQVGSGAFIFLIHKNLFFSLMYHELEGRLISPPDWERNYSIPLIVKTTWMTFGLSF